MNYIQSLLDMALGVKIRYGIEPVITKHSTVEAASADGECRGNPVHSAEILLDTRLHISTKIRDTFAVLPKRWIVE